MRVWVVARMTSESTVTSLAGQLLVAMPQMGDPRFARSVIYLCTHSGDAGAMGLVINKVLGSLTLAELFAQLEIESGRFAKKRPVHFGGPVEPGAVLYCTPTNIAKKGPYRWPATSRSPRRSTSCARSPKARARARVCLRSAMPLGAGPARCRNSGQWLAFGRGR